MKRLAFNGGEISPVMALRSDMDVYARSCTRLENWEVSPTGGISRRCGMRDVAAALDGVVALIPFVYSEDVTYVVELGCDRLRVRSGRPPFGVVQEFAGGDGADWGYDPMSRVTWQQINSLLLICSGSCDMMQLKVDEAGVWSFAPFRFKCPPWMTTDLRDGHITLAPTDARGIYSIAYDEGVERAEMEPDEGDVLRASYYTARREARAGSAELRDGSWTMLDVGGAGLTAAHGFAVGDKVAAAGEMQYECYVCTTDWTGANDFTAGCTSPANYPDNFLLAEDMTGFDEVAPVFGLESGTTCRKGDKLKLKSGYWKLYTCMRAWDGAADMVPGLTDPADYPAHFIAGVPVGEALPCKGTWKFHCSGAWFGSYEVRRSYDSGALTGLWETLGESFSPIAAAENNIITGNEEGEEAYLRLFLTSVRYKGADLAAGWPPDSCDNKLVVSAYKHDMQLKVLADGYLQDISGVELALRAPLATDDWSWSAFNARYGYPTLAALHESRLVLAGTWLQPQTIWMSRTDDLDNFATGAGDDAALYLTMQTTTQAAICWMTSRSDCLMLGTEDAEWVVNSGRSGALTAANARLENHGYIGAAHIPAVRALDKVLYCERGSGRVYEYGYHYEQDAYTSTDTTIFADHIAAKGGGIVGGTVLRKPYCVAVFVLADGTLALMSYNTMHNVNAWHRYTTDGAVHAVAALPDGTRRDRLFLLVGRDGEERIEVMDADSGYVDAGGRDYVSTVETTAFSVPDADDRKVPQAKLMAYMGEPVPAEVLECTTGNEGWCKLNRSGVLPSGWVEMVALAGWTDRPMVGLRVRGDVPCTVLAMQA